ncbi:MAG: DUF2235 domain-containing protein [Pseudomonadota bacterium]
MRRIMLCLDGTWNHPAQSQEKADGARVFRPTNILKIARMLRPRGVDGVEHLIYYDTGVGAGAQYPGRDNRILRWLDQKLGGAWGAGFEGNVEDAYRFLAHNLQPDDEVYLFGYSRGAAQAHALCSFIDWMQGGIPDKKDTFFVSEFYYRYLKAKGDPSAFEITKRDIEQRGQPQTLLPFRTVNITYLGACDTVFALGSRIRADRASSDDGRAFQFRDSLPRCIAKARHALAIDEMRYDFSPAVWRDAGADTDMLQMWFPGGHGNIGGGRREDGLANNVLRWILDESGLTHDHYDDSFLSFYNAWPYAELDDSLSLHWRLRRPSALLNKDNARRRIHVYPETANFDVADFAFSRLKKGGKTQGGDNAPYQPVNLLRYLAQHKERYAGKLTPALTKVLERF